MKPGAGETDAEPEKMATLAFLTILCVLLEILMHYTLGVSIGYTHFFYVVLVLAAIWYGKKAAIIAACSTNPFAEQRDVSPLRLPLRLAFTASRRCWLVSGISFIPRTA